MRIRSLFGIVGLAALSGGVLVAVSLPASAAPVTVPFTATGEPDEFQVPADVCELTIAAFGAQGGPAPDEVTPGGEGGSATATIAVTPGEILQVNVGVQGGLGNVAAGQGGFPDGADGGTSGGSGASGGGGGGSSDVRQGGTALTDRVVIAGGGGGGAFGLTNGTTPVEGGDGGGTAGDPGQTGITSGSAGTGGGGGTQAAAGAAGSPGGDAGIPTGSGVGGSAFISGGGGGGGLFGGGGGGFSDINPQGMVGGGGGGGSGFTPDGLGMTTGGRTGDGLVEITYDAEAGTCPPTPTTTPTTLAPTPDPAIAILADIRFTG